MPYVFLWTRPSTVLDVFKTVDYQRGPRLFYCYCFHFFILFGLLFDFLIASCYKELSHFIRITKRTCIGKPFIIFETFVSPISRCWNPLHFTVFTTGDNYAIGSRPTVLGALEKYVEEQYGKIMYFKARMRNAGERLNTIYVSDEELKNAVHMDITIEDE